MPWGGRGWHVLLRAEYYRCSLDFQHTATGNILVRKRGEGRRFDASFLQFLQPREGMRPFKMQTRCLGETSRNTALLRWQVLHDNKLLWVLEILAPPKNIPITKRVKKNQSTVLRKNEIPASLELHPEQCVPRLGAEPVDHKRSPARPLQEWKALRRARRVRTARC